MNIEKNGSCDQKNVITQIFQSSYYFISTLGPTTDGTALYINGLLAPELTLQRGKEYTFVVETGLGTDPKGTFHPFYITDDVFGGRQIKAELEAKSEHVYAGVTLG